jgi:tetratricopeptide (TPR) repeat protein
VFLCYSWEDSARIDRLELDLRAAGVPVWRDTDKLWPGQDWRVRVRGAITDGALVFLACFSSRSTAKEQRSQNEELLIAAEAMRRRTGDSWLIPVRFDDCQLPDLDLGAGRTLAGIVRADLFGPQAEAAGDRLVTAIARMAGTASLRKDPAAGWPDQAVISGPGAALRGLRVHSETFVGRDADLRAVLDHLDPDRGDRRTPATCVVSGLPGVGKTELALHAARSALDRPGWFPGGALYADLAGDGSPDGLPAAEALGTMLRMLGYPSGDIPPDLQGRSLLYGSIVEDYAAHGKRLLVVIDNAVSAVQVRPLLPADGTSKALVTSRQALTELNARTHTLGVLDARPSVELLDEALRTILGDADPRIAEAPADALIIAELCGYLPLALRIVAALLADDPSRPLAALASELAKERDRLDVLEMDGLGVRAAFEVSYCRLNASQARAFRLLPSCPGSDLSTEAAAALIGQPTTAARRLLLSLSRAHLIEIRARDRWDMHALIRLFAAEHGHRHAPADRTGEAVTRVLRFFADAAAGAASHLPSPEYLPASDRFASRTDALSWLDAEYDNLCAATAVACEQGEFRLACLLSGSLRPYQAWRGQIQSWLETARTGVKAADALGDVSSFSQAQANQGAALTARFELSGHRNDLADALAAGRQAHAAALAGDLDARAPLADLAATLMAGFEATGGWAYLAEALSSCQQAVSDSPVDSRDRGTYLVSLGRTLRAAAGLTGDLNYLDQAIETCNEASEAAGENLLLQASCLRSLSAALRDRYERTGARADLDDALWASRQAVGAIPDDHPDQGAYLASLSKVLRHRYERTGQHSDLEEAIGIARKAVDKTPDGHSEGPARQSHLGSALAERFRSAGDQGDIDEAIEQCREAAGATPLGHPGRPRRLAAFATALWLAAPPTAHPEGMAIAIAIQREAVDSARPGSPARAQLLIDLGTMSLAFAAHHGNGTVKDYAQRCFSEAAASEQAPSRARLDASRLLAEMHHDQGQSQEALAAIDAAIRLLPQLVPLSLARNDREHALGGLSTLAEQAAAIAVRAARPDRAVEFLEQTRGILASDTITARASDLTLLRRAAPDLAAEFEALRDRIDWLDWQEAGSPAEASSAYPLRSRQALAAARRDAATSWGALLDRIRTGDGLRDFMQPAHLSELARQARIGPIISPYADESHSSALVLTGDPECPVTTVALPGLDPLTAGSKASRLRATRSPAIAASKMSWTSWPGSGTTSPTRYWPPPATPQDRRPGRDGHDCGGAPSVSWPHCHCTRPAATTTTRTRPPALTLFSTESRRRTRPQSADWRTPAPGTSGHQLPEAP